MNLPSRKVPVESLGGDEMSCLRVATNNVSSQITVLSTLFSILTIMLQKTTLEVEALPHFSQVTNSLVM